MQIMINQVKREVRKVGNNSTIIFVKEGEQHKTLMRKGDKLGILYEAKN